MSSCISIRFAKEHLDTVCKVKQANLLDDQQANLLDDRNWLWTVIGAFMLVAWVVCRACEFLRLDVWDREKDI
jgi:type IV secretory pathway component VirB8